MAAALTNAQWAEKQGLLPPSFIQGAQCIPGPDPLQTI
ncbi:Uncharacterised protein [Escherichia coli]|nr:Uncharacterised protein [Escherichia coli]